jgi:hypothetical protein
MLQFASPYLDLTAWLFLVCGVGIGHCFRLGTHCSYSICVKKVTKGGGNLLFFERRDWSGDKRINYVFT